MAGVKSSNNEMRKKKAVGESRSEKIKVMAVTLFDLGVSTMTFVGF